MEVFEIRRREIQREESSSGSSWICKNLSYILTILTVILITGALLVVSHVIAGSSGGLLDKTYEHFQNAEYMVDESCKEEVCTTDDCVSMGTRISTLMNPKADPCTDFYEYACGNYKKLLTVPAGQTQYSPAKETILNILMNIRNIMEIPATEDESSTLQKVKQVYKSCIDTKKRSDKQRESLRSWLSDMELSLEESPNDITMILGTPGSWRTIVSKLEEYQLHTVFEVSFKGSSTPIDKIEIDCPLDLFQPNVYQEDSSENLYKLKVYKEVMDSFLSLLLMEKLKRQEFIGDVLQMETDIARVVQNGESSEQSTLTDEHIMQLKEIWRPLIGEAVQDSEITDSCKYNLAGIISVLNQAPPRVSARYILWKMLSKVAQFLGDDFQNLQLQYTGMVPSWTSPPHEKNWQSCADFIREELGLASYKALMDHGYITPNHIEKIKFAFTSLKREFLLVFRSVPGLDRLTKKLFHIKLTNMKLDFGYPDIIHEPLTLDTVYRDLEINDNYFQSVMNIKKFKSRYFFNRLWYGNSEIPISQISLEHSPLGMKFSYNYKKNVVTVDSTLFQFPLLFYSGKIPKYLKYAETSLLAKVMSHFSDATGCYYDPSGKRWDKALWPYTLREKYDSNMECLLNQTSSSEYWFAENNNTEVINTIMSDMASFLIGYEGLANFLQDDVFERILPIITLNKEQLYFVQVAQKFCEINTPTYFPFHEDITLSARSRVNIAVSNMEHFARIFNCSADSPLNLLTKCNLSS